ncbi:MAG TPA: 6-phosphogluconolactonase [Ignavibacteriaceae bacterium]|nr:6-phosphogluconolactonase [Ignavibacteriaceae bacterium]
MLLKIKRYKTPLDVAEAFAAELKTITDERSVDGEKINIALSGGSTPKILFNVLSEQYSEKIYWEKIHFYWGDERCVLPTDEESNYGMTKKYLLDNIEIPKKNIHRIVGENQPDKEADRYAREIDNSILTAGNGLPEFDIIILGMGTDGHTASIFPDKLELFKSEKICAVTEHPATGQKRITITGSVINNSRRVIFMVTGSEKAGVLKNIFDREKGYKKYPSSHVDPVKGIYEWYLDEKAAMLVKD